MKKTFVVAFFAIVAGSISVMAQDVTSEPVAITVADDAVGIAAADSIPTPKIGYLSYDSILQSMPEYAEVLKCHADLTKQYEAEAIYNETNFKRKFSEYLQGQKDFPQNILLKRQHDLQDEMEKALAFREASDSLLRQAKTDMLAPVKAKLDAAIYAVGMERGYTEIVNTDIHSHLFLNPKDSESAAPFVLARLNFAEQ